MPVDPIADASAPRQPETKKRSETDKSSGKKEFEKEAVLNKLLGNEDKRAFLKKKAAKENALEKTAPSDTSFPLAQKGKYIDEMA